MHYDRPKQWGYPSSWNEIAHKIRMDDELTCNVCKASDVELHVHHIIYNSNYGTNRKENLVTLCRECHESEHKTEFDFGENKPIKNTLEQFNSKLFAIGMNMTIEILDSRIRKFEQFAAILIDELGDHFATYLLVFWEEARRLYESDASVMTSSEAAKGQYFDLMRDADGAL